MDIKAIGANNPAFGYSHPLKTMYKKGQIKLKYGFYGEKITIKNASLEHLKPASQGGKTIYSNLVITSKEANQARGNRPLWEFATWENIKKYLAQFIGVKVKGFDGDEYIKMIIKTVTELLQQGQQCVY